MEVFALIKEQDLLDAIAECQGERNPNANTCRNLASFYTILDHIRESEVEESPTRQVSMPNGYSFSGGYSYESKSEFFNAISGKDINEILSLFDEVMETLMVVEPRLYKSIMRRVS